MIKQLNSPFWGYSAVSVVMVLIACFVESVRISLKDGDNPVERMQAERNAYISFGALFFALTISQLWMTLKRVVDLVMSFCCNCIMEMTS